MPLFVAITAQPQGRNNKREDTKMAEAATIETPDLDDIPQDEPDVNTFTADEDLVPPVHEDVKDPEKDEDPPKNEADDFESRFIELEENYKRASSHIEDLNKALSQVRKENKELKKTRPNDDGEPEFTDAQLLAIMKENGGDEGVLLQVMKQLSKQNNLDIQKITDKKVELAGKKSQVEKLNETWQPYIEKNQDAIDKVVEYHGLGELPEWQQRHLAVGALLVKDWPQILKSIKEQAQQEALSGKVDASRKSNIKNNKPDTTGQDTEAGGGDIKSSWVESAERLGLTGKKRDAYYELMKKSSKKRES